METKCYGVQFPKNIPPLRKALLFKEAERRVKEMGFDEAKRHMSLFGINLRELDSSWQGQSMEISGIDEEATLPPMSAKGNLIMTVPPGEDNKWTSS